MKNKDTIYIDVDDEITSIIDKLQTAENKIVALVLPKRAAVLQSVVNMKLLKRAADAEKKQVVLITSEAGLMPLAGSIGFYVAKTLQSKPEVPSFDEVQDADDIDEEVSEEADFSPKDNADKAIGVLSGDEPEANGAEDSIDMSQEDADDSSKSDSTDKAGASNGKESKDKKLAVPNFLRFRKWLILGAVLLVVLIGGGYYATAVMPRAVITIKTDIAAVVVDRTITLATQQATTNSNDAVLPASIKKFDSVVSQQAAATGQKNLGEKAGGTVTITNCSSPAEPMTVPAGTGISSNGLTFITQKTINLNFSAKSGNNCTVAIGFGSATVDVTATTGGAEYNLDASSFNAAKSANGSYDSTQLKINSGAKFTGGTDNNVKVVSKDDIEGLKQKLATTASDSDKAKATLQTQLSDAGYQPIIETFTAKDPVITSSVQADQPGDVVTVTQTTSYTMFGVKRSDLKILIDAKAAEKINTNTQTILDDGLDKATYSMLGTSSDETVQVKFRDEAMAGPKIDVATLKSQLAGQKSGQAESQIKTLTGVNGATVKLSPFWVTKIPGDANKVTINFEQSNSNGQ